LLWVLEMTFAGLDPTAAPKKATAAAAVDEFGRVQDVQLLQSDEAILGWLQNLGPDNVELVGFDGPTVLPGRMSEDAFIRGELPEARRAAEVALARRGIGCFFTTSKSFAKPWALRCVRLAQKLGGAGFQLVEVYPHATKVMLWGKDYPRPKGRREVRLWLLEALREAGLSWDIQRLPTHDELDAVVAALTAFLAWRGLVEWLGLPEPPVAVPVDRSKLPLRLFLGRTKGGKR